MLNVHISRKFSGFISAVSLIVMGCGALALARGGADIPEFVRFFAWCMTAAMFCGSVIGVRRLLEPPLMFSADGAGITIYYEAARNKYTRTGVFLPWGRVSGLTLEEITVHGGDRGRTWGIVCTLNGPAPFPAREHSAVWLREWDERTVCLDAFTGTLAKQELLDGLLPLWKSASGSGGLEGK